MSDRAERVGKNEALFREVNERIRELSAYETEAEFLCECADVSCTRPITITMTKYQEVRSNATHFVVLSGHVRPDLERVVAENDGFLVVEKLPGLPADFAEATDPRS